MMMLLLKQYNKGELSIENLARIRRKQKIAMETKLKDKLADKEIVRYGIICYFWFFRMVSTNYLDAIAEHR